MSSARWLSPVGRIALFGAAILLAGGAANAQSPSSPNSSHSATAPASYSSSTDYAFVTDSGDGAEPAAPTPAAAGQYDNKSGGGGSTGWKSRIAFEGGAGFNIPVSDTSNYLNTGWQMLVGGGLHFGHGVSLLAEYQFMKDGLPSALVAETGANSGNAHIWGFQLEPIVDLIPKSANKVYVEGGGGFYRKLTNFQNPQAEEFCSYFYCGIGYENVTVGHLSSNQGGFNVGGGYAHKFAGMYGDGKMEIFADVRYMDVLTPAENKSPNGLGVATIGAGTKIIPVTFGIRF